jgi:hypothetical protein
MANLTMSFNISGVIAKLASQVQNARDEVSAELYQFAEEVMTDSKAVVPMDTGALAATGQVHPPEIDGDEISIELGYGDAAVGYAIYVHENLDPGVNWTRPGSGPKYLENPLKAKQDDLPQRLADAFTRGMLK